MKSGTRHLRIDKVTIWLLGGLALAILALSGTALGQSVSLPAEEFFPSETFEFLWAPGQKDDVDDYAWKVCIVRVGVEDFEEKRAPVIPADCQAHSANGGQDGMKISRHSSRMSRPDMKYQHHIAAVGYATPDSSEFIVQDFEFFRIRARSIAYVAGLIQIPEGSKFHEGEPMRFDIDQSKRLALEPIHQDNRVDMVRIYRKPMTSGDAVSPGIYVGQLDVADSGIMFMKPLPVGKYQLHYVRAGQFVVDRADFEVLPFVLRKPLEVKTDIRGHIEVLVPWQICAIAETYESKLVLVKTEGESSRVIDELQYWVPGGLAGSCSNAEGIRLLQEDQERHARQERHVFKTEIRWMYPGFQPGGYEVFLVVNGRAVTRKSFVIDDESAIDTLPTNYPQIEVKVLPAALPGIPVPVYAFFPPGYKIPGAAYELVLQRIEETEYPFQVGAPLERVQTWPLVPGSHHKFAPSMASGSYNLFVEEISQGGTRQTYSGPNGFKVEKTFKVHGPFAAARLDIDSGPHYRKRPVRIGFNGGQEPADTIPQLYNVDMSATCTLGWPSSIRYDQDNHSYIAMDRPVGTHDVALGYVYSDEDRVWRIGSTQFEIVEPGTTLTLLSPDEINIGETASVRLERTDDAARDLTYDVEFVRAGFVAPGGALVYPGFPFIAKRAVTSPDQHRLVEAQVPNVPGDYRVNLIYEGVVIDHREFKVVDPDISTPARLLTGESSRAPSFVSPLATSAPGPEPLNFDCDRTPEAVQPAEQADDPEEEIVNFYPVKNEARFAFVGAVDVIRPDTTSPRQPWQDLLPDDEAEKYKPDDARLLFILGENILGIHGGTPVIKGIDSNIEYELLEAEPPDWDDVIDSDYFRSWSNYYDRKTLLMNKEDKQAFQELEKYLVLAKFPEGQTGGIENFHINGIKAKWVLQKGNVTADIRIIREQDPRGQTGLNRELPDSLDYFFSGDRIAVEVQLSNQVELDEVGVVLRTDEKIIMIGNDMELAALPVPGVPGLYRTPVLTRVAPDGSGRVGPGAKKLPIAAGSVLTALLPHAAPVTMRSPGAALYKKTPNDIGSHWLSTVRKVAWLAEKLEEHSVDPVAFLKVKVGEVSFSHVTGSDTVDITAGDHAALLILRQSFIDQMKPIYKELLDLDAQLGDDPFVLNSFYQMAKRQINNPYHPYQYIEVDPLRGNMFSASVPYHKALDDDYLESNFLYYSDRVDWVRKATRQAFDEYMAATKIAIDHAESIEDDDFEELLKLVSVGFGGVAKNTVPNIVKLSPTPPLRWVPDRLARGYVASVNEMGKRYRANKDLTRAEVNIAIAAAVTVIFAPVAVPMQTMAAGVSVVLAGEYLAYEHPEAVDSRLEAKVALGAVTLLGPDRLNLAESQRVSHSMETLIALGTLVGVGADFVALVHSVRMSRAIVAGSRGLDLLETGGFNTFARLTEQEQIGVAALMQKARNVNLVDPSQLTPLQRRALEASRRIGDGTDYIRELRLHDRILAGGHRTGKEYKFGGKAVNPDPPPTLESGSVFQGMTIGRELGAGSFARVYEIIGPDGKVISERVLKVFHKGPKGSDAVEKSLYVAELLDARGIPQLKILGSGSENGMPFLIQERLTKSQHTYEIVFQFDGIRDVDGVKFQGRYLGLKEFSRLNPDDPSKLLLRKLPRPLQRAYFRLLGEVNNAEAGHIPLIWEDAHLENVYFERLGPNEWRAGILDQDRIMPWGERLAPDHSMYAIQGGLVNMSQITPEPSKVFSLVNAKAPRGDMGLAFPIVQATGAYYPSARFYQAKALEMKGYLVFEPATNTWTSRIADMDIVDESFPQLRDWANFDFDAHYAAELQSAEGSGPR